MMRGKHLWGVLRSLAIYHGQPWKRWRAKRFYSQFIRRGDLCFDIGAHVGGRVGIFAGLGATCVAVEPQPDCVAVLRRLYGRHPRVILVPKAIAAAEGRQTLRVNPGNLTVSSLSGEWIDAVRQSEGFAHLAWAEGVEVMVVTLDGLIAAHGLPDFCKIDVEGGELAVLQGLSQPLPALSLEYIPATVGMTVQCIERLESLGRYRYNRATGEGFTFTNPQWRDGAAMIRELTSLPGDAGSGDLYAASLQ
jgi:FkbM family methyltransferase